MRFYAPKQPVLRLEHIAEAIFFLVADLNWVIFRFAVVKLQL